MTKHTLIDKTIQTLSGLPQEKVEAVSDFAEYIAKKYEEEILQKGIEKLVSESNVFDFLEEEQELYSVDDLKEKY